MRRPIPQGRRAAETHIFDDPSGMGHCFQQDRGLQLQRLEDAAAAYARKTVTEVAFALGMHWHVDGQDQRPDPGISGTSDQGIGNIAVLGGI